MTSRPERISSERERWAAGGIKERKVLLRVKGSTRLKQETTDPGERFVAAWHAHFVTAARVLGSTTSPRCVITLSMMP